MSDITRPGASFGPAGAVTPSDDVDLEKVNGHWPRGFRVNGAGDVAFMAPDGTIGVFTCAGPETLAQQAKRVMDTGTTVTASIVPIY